MSSMDSYFTNYEKGVEVWLPDDKNVWIEAQIVSRLGNCLTVSFKSGKTKALYIKCEEDLPFLKNPDFLIGAKDLTSLSYLHEPAVLHNLKSRFLETNYIYTYCGIVLVAINPYCDQSIYSAEYMQLYSQNCSIDSHCLDPHIYSIANEAAVDLQLYNRNQSVIVSGESGAGKTVNAKHIMRYLAELNTVGCAERSTSIEHRVLVSSPLLEAFGNAKTIRNDNSSRFGKFIQLECVDNRAPLQLCGASLRTYLLEKSRIVFQTAGERNYHIFYYLCAAASLQPEEFYEIISLNLSSASNFNYTKHQSLDITGVDEVQLFREVCDSLISLGFLPEERLSIFIILAAILHLGNIFVKSIVKDSGQIDVNHLQMLCRLLQIDESAFKKWMHYRQICAAGERPIEKPLNFEEMVFSRDALAKHLYANLFDWIVRKVNICLKSMQITNRFIGVLDIYGFEVFEINSFEQFCINYANEKLQQQFSQHVFSLEQAEYIREGIEWSNIEFYDNAPCIDIIERRLGVISLLDEECKMPKGNDSSWLVKLKHNCCCSSEKQWFSIPKFPAGTFTIRHFAGQVDYTANEFIEKNRDSVSRDLLEVINQSEWNFIGEILKVDKQQNNASLFDNSAYSGRNDWKSGRQQINKGGYIGTLQTKSVASQFKSSLQQLMDVLRETVPHFVRCIKPNDFKLPFSMDALRTHEQLRACGVLETIRISAAGYPSRYLYQEFYDRYRILVAGKLFNNNKLKQDKRRCCQLICECCDLDSKGGYQFGATKIFFRTGHVAHLERCRAEIQRRSATCIQRLARGWLARLLYQRLREALATIHHSCKAWLVFKRVVVGLQRFRRFALIYAAVVQIQACSRGKLIRFRYLQLRYEYSARIIQRWWLCRLERQRLLRARRAAIKIQCCYRCYRARQLLKALKKEARSVDHVKKLNRGLENKIMELQRKLQEMSELWRASDLKCSNLTGELAGVREMLLVQTDALKSLSEQKVQLDKKLVALQNSNDNLEKARAGLVAEISETAAKLVAESNRAAKLQSELQSITSAHSMLIKDYAMLEEQIASQNYSSPESSSVFDQPIEINNSASEIVEQKEMLVSKEGGDLLDTCLHQQDRINKLERDRLDLMNKLEEAARNNELLRLEMVDKDVTKTSLQLKSMIMENEKMSSELKLMHEKADISSIDIQGYWNRQLVECQRVREESIDLRTQLVKLSGDGANPIVNQMSAANQQLRKLNVTFKSQLENREQQIEDLLAELNNVKQDNHGIAAKDATAACKDLQQSLNGVVDASATATKVGVDTTKLNLELGRLVSENLMLREKLDRKEMQITKLRKRQTRDATTTAASITSSQGQLPALSASAAERNRMLQVDVMQLVFNLGMFKYDLSSIPSITRALVTGLKPRVAMQWHDACAPAFVVLMCFRYADTENDECLLSELFTSFTSAVQATVKKHGDDLNVSILWLSNCVRLMHLCQQYSDNKEFLSENSSVQNGHCLLNFDLSSFVDHLGRLCEGIYGRVLEICEKIVVPLIVPALLENEGVSLATSQSSSVFSRFQAARHSLNSLLQQLTHINDVCVQFGLEFPVCQQLVAQLAHWVCVKSLNMMFVRREYCNWERGINIKYNVTELHSWCNNAGYQAEVTRQLEPLRQMANLLITRKSLDDVHSLCECATQLSTPQVLKILQQYKALDNEERVSPELIQLVGDELRWRRKESASAIIPCVASLNRFPVLFPFVASQLSFDKFELPADLKLSMLRRI